MNLNSIEELICQMIPDDGAIENAKEMINKIRKQPQAALVQMIGSAPSLMKHEEKSAWVYGIICGVAMSAASVESGMTKNFQK